jgi:hypothetical protein
MADFLTYLQVVVRMFAAADLRRMGGPANFHKKWKPRARPAAAVGWIAFSPPISREKTADFPD